MAPSQPSFRLRSALILAGVLGAPFCTSALTLGDADLRSFRGQPLELRIPLRVERNEYVGLECFKVRAAQGGSSALQPLASGRFRLEESLDSATLLLRTYESFNAQEAIVEVVARCADAKGEVSRVYRLDMPALDGSAAQGNDAAPAMVIIQRPGEAPIVQPLGAPGAQTPTAATKGARTWRVGKGESLDSIARGIYPKSAKLRTAFISRLRGANAQPLPADKEPLPEGLVLNWPDLVALANASPRIDAPAAQGPTTAQVEPRKTAASPTAREKSTAAAPVPRAEATAASATKSGTQAGAEPSRTESRPAAPAKVEARTAAPAKSKADSGFTLRLSGADLDLSRSKGVSESTRAGLREKQLLLDADDQVAALLSLRNTVKQLEGRLNEMQLKLATLPPASSSIDSKTQPAAPAKTAPAASTTSPAVVAPQPANAEAAAKAPATVASAPALPASSTAESKSAESPKPANASAPPVNKADQTGTASKDASQEEIRSEWWTSPYLALGLALLLLLIGLAIWARRRPRENEQAEFLAPSSAGHLSDGPRSSSSPAPQAGANSIAEQYDDDLDRRFGESAKSASNPVRSAEPAESEAGPRSAFRPQDTLRIHAPITQEVEDEFFSTSLELDTRPATSIDFVLGDEFGEDKSRRQRYMEERFPELASRSISVDDPDSVIDAARHYYEESELQRSIELLTYAFEERPGQLRFWLALFEIFRLEQRAEDFLELATRFKNVHGGTDAWPKVQHIGRDLDPSQPLYSAALGRLGVPLDSDFDPVSENWLNVPMDFTSDVLMIELRQAVLAEHAVDATRLTRPLLEMS